MARGGVVGSKYKEATGLSQQTTPKSLLMLPRPDFNAFDVQGQLDAMKLANCKMVQAQLEKMRIIVDDLRAWINQYENTYGEFGYVEFKRDWKFFRCGISLQIRLVAEQILYEKGYPWRRLVTGFGCIE